MANANIDALYAGNLQINVAYVFFSSNLTFYLWCVTKVAHCMSLYVVLCTNYANKICLNQRSGMIQSNIIPGPGHHMGK